MIHRGYVVPVNAKVLYSDDFTQPTLDPAGSQVFATQIRYGRMLPRGDRWRTAEERIDADFDDLFYGTLQSPLILREILSLPFAPTLRPAYIRGFKMRMWGQYPAVVASEDDGGTVRGMAFDVPDQIAAGKLGAYETRWYRVERARVWFEDRGGEGTEGYVFVFGGGGLYFGFCCCKVRHVFTSFS